MTFIDFVIVALNLGILLGFVLITFMVGYGIGYNKAKKEAFDIVLIKLKLAQSIFVDELKEATYGPVIERTRGKLEGIQEAIDITKKEGGFDDIR